MSDKEAKEAKEAKDEVKEVEAKEETKESTVGADLFISEEDTFEIQFLYYKEDSDIMVQGLDDEYDETKKAEVIKAKFKYPSQGDCNLIALHAREDLNSDEFTVQNFQNIEFTRILVLIRDWNLAREINNDNILSLHPKIIKGLASALRSEIGVEGIV